MHSVNKISNDFHAKNPKRDTKRIGERKEELEQNKSLNSKLYTIMMMAVILLVEKDGRHQA